MQVKIQMRQLNEAKVPTAALPIQGDLTAKPRNLLAY